MIEFAMTTAVVLMLTIVVAVRSTSYAPEMRKWLWLALLEYLLCALYQFLHGADANGYRQIGADFAHALDASFSWASGELVSLLLQQPSGFDGAAVGPGTNTGSMCAAAGWILFFVRGSAYAAQALVAGLAMLGSLAVYEACRDASPESSQQRLFFATVLFPSVAFWTSALHKEAFCLMGMGLLLAAWRAIYRRRARALLYAPLGLLLIVTFRAPALPPLALGLVLYFVTERIQKTRGSGSVIGRPVYVLVGLGVMAGAMVLVSRVSPDLAIERIGDTVALQQRAWSTLAANGEIGGSGFGLDDVGKNQSAAGQIARAPVALLNALFRPQLFDITSPVVAVSAIEMTLLTYLLVTAVRRHGVRGIATRVQQSPFLLMCAAITIVGSTFVGLTTFNFGTLARYRVPFLPFYGALLAGLTQKAKAPDGARAPDPRAALRRRPRRQRPARLPEPTS